VIGYSYRSLKPNGKAPEKQALFAPPVLPGKKNTFFEAPEVSEESPLLEELRK